MAGPISGEDLVRASLKTFYQINKFMHEITTLVLATYGAYCLFKDNTDIDAEDETPEREETAPATPSSG
jgi:hypothetical protein